MCTYVARHACMFVKFGSSKRFMYQNLTAELCYTIWFTLADCGGEDGILRLFNETSVMEGQVQFCFNSMWTPVCGDNWGDNEASVVCRQLGFSREGMVYTVIS